MNDTENNTLSLPSWAKTVGSVVAGTFIAIGWAETRFVNRSTYDAHLSAEVGKVDDLGAKIREVADLIRDHAQQPSHNGTIQELRDISDRLTRIETSLGLPSYRGQRNRLLRGLE